MLPFERIGTRTRIGTSARIPATLCGSELDATWRTPPLSPCTYGTPNQISHHSLPQSPIVYRKKLDVEQPLWNDSSLNRRVGTPEATSAGLQSTLIDDTIRDSLALRYNYLVSSFPLFRTPSHVPTIYTLPPFFTSTVRYPTTDSTVPFQTSWEVWASWIPFDSNQTRYQV